MKKHHKEKKLTLLNPEGEIVRIISWDKASAIFIKNEDSKRIEIYSTLKDIKAQNINYTLLAKTQMKSLKTRPIKLGSFGIVKYQDTAGKQISANINPTQENNEDYKKILKWTSLAHLGVLLIIISIGYLFNPKEDNEPEKIVTILKVRPPVTKIKVTQNVPKNKVTRKFVKPVRKKKIAKKVKVRNYIKRPTRKKIKPRKRARPVSIHNQGVLGALGSLNKKSKRLGGINFKSINSNGPGRGGKNGSGGIQTSLYAKGLVSAPVGPGRVRGAGGYGTKGRGGGRAGYGAISLAGSSSAYFLPVTTEDISVQGGGLTKEQVAKVISQHLGLIRRCYERGLQVSPSLKGRVITQFIINGQGRVFAARIPSSTLNSKIVENCIANHLVRWQFPKPTDGVNVRVKHPFALRRAKAN